MVQRTLRTGIVSAQLLLGTVLAASCGAGGMHSAMVPSAQATPASLAPAYTGPVAPATFSITFPAPGAAAANATARVPQYVPASTRSVSILVLQVGGVSVASTALVTNVTPGSAPCGTVASGNYTCTIAASIPIGSDNTQLALYDAANAGGNLLSQQLQTVAVVEGHANQFGSAGAPITLDANPGAIAVSALAGPTGTYPNFAVTGTGTATFTVGVVDAHGTAFGSQPGQPTLTHAAATGTGASATVSGTTLSLTPPTSGASTNVVVDADPLGAKVVNTTLSSSPAAAATSFTVAATTNMFVGMNVVLDYETFSGTTLIQEAAKIAGIAGSTITVSTGLAHAHASAATVYAYADNLTPSTAPFAVAIAATLIVPVAQNMNNFDSKALVYNPSFALQTGTLTSTTASYNNARLDSANQLYIADLSLDKVYRSPWTAGTGFGAITTYSGIPASQPGAFGFDVSPSGGVVVENAPGQSPNLDVFAPGASSPSTFTSGNLSASSWETVTEQSYPTAAILSDTSGNVYGYAYGMWNINGVAHDQLVVTSGTSEQDLNSSSIVSEFANDATAAALAFDVGRQSLIYVNSDTGSGSTYTILEFAHTGSTDTATFSTTPTSVGSVAGSPLFVATSHANGNYIAVAWINGGGTGSVTIFFNNGTTWSPVTTLSTTFPSFTSMHFIHSGNLIVSSSDGNISDLYQFTPAGAQVGSTYNAQADFGASYMINDVAVSY